MRKNLVLAFLLLFAIVLNGDIFDRLFSTSKSGSISQGEVTLFALHAMQNRYLNKAKLRPEDLLDKALEAIQEDFAEVVVFYDREKHKVFLQIYNKQHTIEVKRMNDLWDIAVVLRQAYSHFEKEYKPEGDREIGDIEYVAVNGILKKLDPHSYIFTPKEFEEFTSSTEGNFGGLGIVIQANEDGEIFVVSPIDGTPAERAGIVSGDVIVQINDESAINMSLNKAVERMRGQPGTPVSLYVRRKGAPSVIRFDLERAVIKIQSVVSSMPQKGIGYIKLSGFMENSYDQFVSALSDLRKKGMRALVLDMRGNSGGLLNQAIKISDLFLDRGVIVSTVGDDERDVSEASRQSSDILDVPVVVMVNEGSASATEIVAAALKKNGRATVVGRRTFGKGSVQNLFRIPRGGGLKLTIAQYLTPGDISIQTIGVEPDIEYQPSYVDPRKLSLFKTRSNIMGEKDLKEHLISAYLPKEPDTPKLTIHYLKPYKTPDEMLKESRREKMGVFKNDEEIQLSFDLLKAQLSRKEPVLTSADTLRAAHLAAITAKLGELGISWKKDPAPATIRQADLKVTLVSGNPLKAGTEAKLLFRATYPGSIDNLIAAFDTDIPFLRNLEIPFGSFSESIEREVPVTLPEHMPWRRQPVRVDLSVDSFRSVAKTEKVEIEISPLEQPDVRFALLLKESVGAMNGILESSEQVTASISVKNIGKGAILDGRLQLINVNNSPELFISKGNEPLILKPGEEKEVVFSFKIGAVTAKSRIALAVSLYDYKTKYSAGFSIPFGERDLSCRYEETGDRPIVLATGTPLYPDVRLSAPIAVLRSPATLRSTGRCGEAAIRLQDGYWARSSDLPSTPPAGIGPLALDRRYDIAMPVLTLDRSPQTSTAPNGRLSFTVTGEEVQDIFAYQNNRKVFYYRLGDGETKRDFSVPLTFKEKTNKIMIVAKGKDRERTGVATRYFYYPGGKEESLSAEEPEE